MDKKIAKSLEDIAKKTEDVRVWEQPRSYELSKDSDVEALSKLMSSGAVVRVFDQINLAIDELFDIEYPAKKDTKSKDEVAQFASRVTNGDPSSYGSWFFFPWNGSLVHFPPKHDLRALRTSRNRNLITAEEQTKLYEGTIAIFGMSVGSNIVEALISQGIGGKLILADMDTIEPSNLNRIRMPYHEVGTHKIDAIAKRVSEVDPYIQQIHYHDGLTEANLSELIQKHSPDILIDEMDALHMKLEVRIAAKKHKLPVIMGADDGDNALIDIERYDKDSKLEYFSGRIPKPILERLKKDDLSRPEIGMLIGKYFVGADHIPLRMYASLSEVGKTLPSWPQLGGAAALAGISLAFCAKKIILDQPLHDGRHLVAVDEKLDPVILSDDYQAQLKKFQSMMEG
ncbi:ThiF family adenylyltransferase [bacterium]|nr:ThiF family adenylyltransferase [bacterium]